MPDRFNILAVTSHADAQDARRLFEEYAATLPVDLAYQDFEAELAALPGKYAPPGGVLLIARDPDNTPVGCVAVRPLADGVCEIKRLYLRPSARGTGLGRALATGAVGAAVDLSYREVRLDTLPSMDAALRLYESIGFTRRDAYYAPTPPGTVFLSKRL